MSMLHQTVLLVVDRYSNVCVSGLPNILIFKVIVIGISIILLAYNN